MVYKILTLLPTLIESWLDRKGEKKQGKIKDTIWLTVGSVLYIMVTWKIFNQNPFIILAYILMWRVTLFDYLTNFMLKKFSDGHKQINIWKYTGTTTFWWDQLTSKIDWRWRLIFRIVILAAGVSHLILPFPYDIYGIHINH